MLATHVITRLIVGGAQENTIATVLGLQNKPDFESDLISGPSEANEGSLEGLFADQPHLLKICPSLVRPVHPLKDCQALRELRRIFRSSRPLIVHTHSGKAGILGRWAAHLERVPIIIHSIHGPSFGPWQGAMANFAFRAAERSAARITTHFIAVAQAMIDQYLAAGISSPEHYSRIFSGFPLSPFLQAENRPEVRSRYGLEPHHVVIGKIARMTALKGHEDLFAIAPAIVQSLPNARFLLVGGGPWEPQFRERARELGLEKHFVFTGIVPPSQIPELTGIMDLLLHLSLREGLPRALPQAMAAGKPVIAYDVDGAREVCLDGETGFLISSGDRSTLLQRVQTLAGNWRLRRELGSAGQRMVQKNFSVEGMVEGIYQLYLQQISRWQRNAPPKARKS